MIANKKVVVMDIRDLVNMAIFAMMPWPIKLRIYHKRMSKTSKGE